MWCTGGSIRGLEWGRSLAFRLWPFVFRLWTFDFDTIMNRLTIAGVVIVTILVLVALFAPWIAPYDVGTTDLSIRYLPPSVAHWFGTDSTGRDIFSRVVFGARISLQV